MLKCGNRLILKISCAVNRAFPEGAIKMVSIISGIWKTYGAISLKMCQESRKASMCTSVLIGLQMCYYLRQVY